MKECWTFHVILWYYFWVTLSSTAPWSSSLSTVWRTGQRPASEKERDVVPRTEPERAKSSDRGQPSPKFTTHVEKLHPRRLIISARELHLQRPEILNSNFNIYRSTWTQGGKKKPVIAKRRNKLNPQKWVQLTGIATIVPKQTFKSCS